MSIEQDVQKYWEADSDERRHYAHYRARLGHEAWNALGESVLKRIESFVKIEPDMTVLEYGCGGGAITTALLKKGAIVQAIDICSEALYETMCMAREVGAHDRLLVTRINADYPEELCESLDRYDLIVSTAVFQHFPSKEYASRILEIFGKIASKKTKAVIQIRNDDGNPQFVQKTGDYRSQAITYTSHGCGDFMGRANRAGWTVRHVEKGANNYAWYYMR